ncbi:putative NAD dependent epimerase/dehydratase [Colletotrichum godetiae]|uniref:NAD dependent epimerase/dehydratase n=1 Tax=Colletotrichum godetiae TaxID=1209918 RepID=A0AAJ0ENX3_9PEZI|nr:putative NAD dependent epimerase/dehydratase [Colletotrichum godetiae]KAK1659071.1 putative NAD dependent epimerase/dehydratase [Colletotrichum godetiae]
MSQHTIFVSGATGTVGGSVARNLLGAGIAVHALARDPSSPAAKALSSLGASLTPGGYDNEGALEKAMKGVTGAFLNLMPDFVDHDWELKTAKRIMAAAKTAGATHFIYSSSFSVDAPEKLKYWDPESFTAVVLLSKQAIENEVRNGRFITALRPETKLPTVDPNDIGQFALAAYVDPDKFHTEEISLASELLTADEITGKLARFTGKDIRTVFLADEEVEAQKGGNPFLAGQLAMRDMEQFADIEGTRSWGVPLGTLDRYLEREKDRVTETYGHLA